MIRRTAIMIAAMLLLNSCFVGNMLCNRVLTPERDPGDLARTREFAVTAYPYLGEWLDSMESNGVFRDTVLRTSDGLLKHATLASAPRPCANTAVVVHGYLSSPYKMMMLAQFYREQMGWNVIIPHLEYHGLNEGGAIQMGWLDRYDVKEWSDLAHSSFKDSLQVLHGVSMGAATVMMLSGDDDLPPYIRGFVEDCGYTSVWEEYEYQARQMFKLPAWPVLYWMENCCRRRYGWTLHEASCTEQLKKSTLPMLFIHGSADTFVPPEMARANYEAKTQGYKELWITEGSDHAMSWRDHPREYAARVRNFIEQHVQ